MIKCELCGRYNNKAELTAGRHAICDDCADALIKAVARIRQVVEANTVDHPPDQPAKWDPAALGQINEALADVAEPKAVEREKE